MADEVKVDRFRRNLLKATGIAGTAVLAMGLAAKPAAAKGHGGSGGSSGSGGCFLKGTLIRTADGERAIETLSVGDVVETHFGSRTSIKAVDNFFVTTLGADHAWLGHLRPVWVRRGALADNVPSSDLCLTAAHALWMNGYLVPVGQLVNGTSIVFDVSEQPEPLWFYHIELEHHDLLDANGSPCESLRAAEEQPCAPLLGFDGARSELKSRLRSAASAFIDRRHPLDVIRDSLEERALGLARAA